MKLFIFTLSLLIQIAYGNDIDTIEVSIAKPLWIGIIPRGSVEQLTGRCGIIVSETDVPRRTAVFEEKHKLVLNNDRVMSTKERSYTIRMPDLQSNIKVSKYLYTGAGKKKPTVTMLDTPITIELSEIIKGPDSVCKTKNVSSVLKKIIKHFFTTEHIITQAQYGREGSTREEVYLSHSISGKNKPPKFTDISGDLTKAHLHYLLHNVFIGEESTIPTYVRLGSDMGFTIEANRISRYIDGEPQDDDKITQQTLDSSLDFLRGEATTIWQTEMSGLASSRKPEASSQFSQEAYRDDLLSTTCSSTIVRVLISTSQVTAVQGIIITTPELEHGVLIYDNSFGEEVGDEYKVDVSMGARLSRLSIRRRSSSETDVSTLREYQDRMKNVHRKTMYHVYDSVASNYDVPRHAISASAIVPIYDTLCKPKEEFFYKKKDDDDDESNPYSRRYSPFLTLPGVSGPVTDL